MLAGGTDPVERQLVVDFSVSVAPGQFVFQRVEMMAARRWLDGAAPTTDQEVTVLPGHVQEVVGGLAGGANRTNDLCFLKQAQAPVYGRWIEWVPFTHCLGDCSQGQWQTRFRQHLEDGPPTGRSPKLQVTAAA